MTRTTLNPGDVIEIQVEKGIYGGLGLARHMGQVVFVSRGLPGDRVRVEVETVTKGYIRAGIKERLEGGANRREPPCRYAGRCGGCSYQELELPASRVLKEEILRESLRRSGVAWEAPIPLAASPEVGWRSRASLHFAFREGALTLGLHEEGSHKVVDVEECLQLSTSMNKAARAVRDAVADRPGLGARVSGLEISESPDRLVLCLKTNLSAGEVPRFASLARAVPEATGFGIEGEREAFVTLSGEPFLEWKVQGLALRAHVQSFFQSNRFLFPELVGAVLELLPYGPSVLDLYAGVGLFALPAGARGVPVRGAELNPWAVKDAEANAAAAGLTDVRVEKGDVLAVLSKWRSIGQEVVILDPPRTGAGKGVVRAIASRHPRAVVYVSCDPPTLGRDLKEFARGGYALRELRAFDLFPDTSHLEAVALLEPAPGTLC